MLKTLFSGFMSIPSLNSCRLLFYYTPILALSFRVAITTKYYKLCFLYNL